MSKAGGLQDCPELGGKVHRKRLQRTQDLYPEHDASGSVTAYDGYAIDITERMQFQERLMRAQKLEAVGTLAGGMAHDFNNLLTAILGYSKIILSKTKEGDSFHKPASIIYEAATRGAEFGQKILSMMRKQQMELKPVDLNEVVKNSIELLNRSMPKDIEITTSLYNGLPMATADPSQIQQVIINLAVNRQGDSGEDRRSIFYYQGGWQRHRTGIVHRPRL